MRKPIKLIAAVALNQTIGNNGKLAWHDVADLNHFKQLTTGGAVIMGARTFLLDLKGKCLPNRRNIVIRHYCSSLDNADVEEYHRAFGVADAIGESGDLGTWVIGGSSIYQMFLPFVSDLHITHLHFPVEGDTFFPPVKWEKWKIESVEKHTHFSYVHYSRKQPTVR